MTKDKDFKTVVRERTEKTGESYSIARSKLLDKRDTPNELLEVRDALASSFHEFWGEFRPGLRGLTDGEYIWEPVAGCPTVRLQADGTYRVDGQFPVRGAATIAQRLCWIARLTLQRTNQHFGDKTITSLTDGPVPGTATAGVAFLGGALEAWTAELRDCEPKRLIEHSENTSPGAIDGEFPFIGVVQHQFQLLVQCATSVAVTRDWYLTTHPEVVSPS